MILETSDTEAGLEAEKSEGVTGGEGECGEVKEELLASKRQSFAINAALRGCYRGAAASGAASFGGPQLVGVGSCAVCN